MKPWDYYWRVRTKFAGQFGRRCRVHGRARRKQTAAAAGVTLTIGYPRRTQWGGGNSALVEFTDGVQVVTSCNYVRRYREPARSGGRQR